jgi:hypothetical protein
MPTDSDMNSEAEKIVVIRRHLTNLFPTWTIKDGSRTSADRTLQLFEGVTLKSTAQIGMDLLQDSHCSPSKLALALQDKDIAGWVLAGSTIYLNNNTLGINEDKPQTAEL